MQVATQSAGDASVPASTAQTAQNGVVLRPATSRDGRTPIREVACLYFAEYSGKDRTRPQRVGYWVDRFGDRPIGDLIDDDVAEALDELAGRRGRVFAGHDADGQAVFRAKRKPLTGSTILRYAAALSALCTFAIRRRLVPRGWPHPVHTVEKPRENAPKTRFLDRDEVVRLLAGCRASRWPRLYAFTLAALVTGCRRGELVRLTWADVDFSEGVARLATSKNGRPRVVPLTIDLMAELRKFEGRGDGLVFESPRKPGKPMQVAAALDTAVKRAGLRGVTTHTLRHSCASFLVANGATLFEVQTVLGHSTPAMSARYSHLAIAHKASLVRKVFEGFATEETP